MDFPNYNYFVDGEEEREMNIELEHRRRVILQVDIRLILRDTLDPFAISVSEFRKLYRLAQHEVMELVNVISPYIPMHVNNTHIPLHARLLCALSFYASGSYQRIVGRDCSLCISQSSVSTFISEITGALSHPDILMRFIHFPETRAEREVTIARNDELGMPRTLGYIDGTLVKIVPPPMNEHREVYYCRKGYPALNVQIVCDAKLYIMRTNARYPGSSNDPFIYRASGMREEMMEAYRQSRCWLLGDSIYPHEPWLQTPLPHAEEGTPEYIYTKLHCHCRNLIERCNGVLKERWRCLLWDRTLHYRPAKAGLIVNACAVLHNFCILRNVPEPCVRILPVPENASGLYDEDYDYEEDNYGENREGQRRLRQRAEEERRFLIDHAVRHRAVE